MIDKIVVEHIAVEAAVRLFQPHDEELVGWVYEWYPDMLKFLNDLNDNSDLINMQENSISYFLSKFMYSQTEQQTSLSAFDDIAKLIYARIYNYKLYGKAD